MPREQKPLPGPHTYWKLATLLGFLLSSLLVGWLFYRIIC